MLINNQNETPSLLKVTALPRGHWVILKLEGTRSNRSAIGARVKLSAGGHTQFQAVQSGGSYLSQNDLRLHFGIGTAARVDRIEVQWPAGTRQNITNVAPDRIVNIREP